VTVDLELVSGRDPRVEATWRTLEPAAPSYFQSWGWIATWLAMLPPTQIPELAVVREDARPIAACFLGRRRILEHHVMPSRARVVNATGVPRFDELCVEHNAIIGMPALETLLALLPHDWDELVLPAFDASALPHLPSSPWRVCVDREVAAPYVDLARVRAAPGGYVSLLGSKTRAHLRRALRAAGELTVEHASDVDHALAIYTELVALHTASWHKRGEPGAFADPWFDAFHRRLIADRFAAGEIELVRVRAGDRTIGCLYNYVWRDRVAVYQTGYAPLSDPRDQPGFVCFAAAIEHAAATGHAVFDFLGGDADYKRRLSTDTGALVWLRIQRPLLRFVVEDRLRTWRRARSTQV
jgi:CelD/BcsL family acetyltransferase involved in cellulose biosynthesis